MKTRMILNKPLVGAAILLSAVAGAFAVPVTFQVNMGYQASLGNFAPGNEVTARGSFNGWSGGFVLTNNPVNTDIYQGTIDVSGSAGDTVFFKFVYNNGSDH